MKRLSPPIRLSAFRLPPSAFAIALATANIAFSKPVNFTEALQSREVRSPLPTTLSSAEISQISSDILERATVSAQMTSAKVLQRIDDITRAMATGQMDSATARLRLIEVLRDISYVPEFGEAGTIKDFLSDQRVDAIIQTNAAMAQGYGQFIQGQRSGVLDAYPCQELFRLRARKVERFWPLRWKDVGGKMHGTRMIARKDDPIWERLGTEFDDSLGNPYPPFAFGSGMWVKDVSRSDAIRLGVIDKDAVVQPQTRGFNDDLKFPADLRTTALRQALLESLGPGYKITEGILSQA